jgi:hypothetical protein
MSRRFHPSILRRIRWQLWSLLAWSQRHTVALWWRSLKGEVHRGQPLDFGRVRTLLKALYKVSAEPRLSNAPQLRTLALVNDTVVAESDQHWHERDLLGHLLRGIDHVNEVQFVDSAMGSAAV